MKKGADIHSPAFGQCIERLSFVGPYDRKSINFCIFLCRKVYNTGETCFERGNRKTSKVCDGIPFRNKYGIFLISWYPFRFQPLVKVAQFFLIRGSLPRNFLKRSATG